MKFSTGIRHLREGGKSLLRNGWMTFASSSAIAISLFILGVFLLLTVNVNAFADQVESDVQIRAFLDDSVKGEQIQELQARIEAIPNVRKVVFVSKEQGMRDFIASVPPENRSAYESLTGDENPLPDSFTIEVSEPRQVQAAADAILALNEGKTPPPIYKLNYGGDTVKVLFKVTATVRYVGLGLVVALALTAMFLIANTIKVTIFARQREISIMKLVGATNSFIRWPFFIEGALLGLIGSIIPIAILLPGYYKLTEFAHLEMGLSLVRLVPFSEVAWQLSGVLLGLGLLIGIWGSVISIRKFVRI
ncbi:permease-like cell division protein FtsX [Paenibacillus thermoaerophilus]|jgi:cell division transport system permease protein|uniref:Cell division protein FtsX n=1 Tax=Paenibacillus thermoaerophilus TaxID=1215385 RepID=A0ABW2V5L8_9BACL|nr:permease-like cell division protein FtsX [Paenibacillus thermoaerophilus]TMV09202.1 ABC transporter permease [Paenibacillus thermoaerophilus]